MENSDTNVTRTGHEQFKADIPNGPPEHDREAEQIILLGQPDGVILKRWRRSMRMSVAGLARVLHMSRRHIIRLERGAYPITEHFLVQLRGYVVGLPDPLPAVPAGISVRPKPPLGRAEAWVPLTKLAGREGHTEWRKCAGCHEMFLFTDKRKLYHNRDCKEAAQRRGESVGTKSNLSPNYAPRLFRCPSCGHVHPLAGNMVKPDVKIPD